MIIQHSLTSVCNFASYTIASHGFNKATEGLLVAPTSSEGFCMNILWSCPGDLILVTMVVVLYAK